MTLISPLIAEVSKTLEMLFWMALLRGIEATTGASLRQLVQRSLRWIPTSQALPCISAALLKSLKRSERSSWRARRWVPGSTCRHQALALRISFALRGISSQVKVAMKAERSLGETHWRGHAWIEVASADGDLLVLLEALEGASIILSEAQLLGLKTTTPNP